MPRHGEQLMDVRDDSLASNYCASA